MLILQVRPEMKTATILQNHECLNICQNIHCVYVLLCHAKQGVNNLFVTVKINPFFKRSYHSSFTYKVFRNGIAIVAVCVTVNIHPSLVPVAGKRPACGCNSNPGLRHSVPIAA